MSQDRPPEATRVSARVALLTALALLVVAVVLFIIVANNLGSGGSDTEIGGGPDADLFVAGRATVLAEAVRKDGPILLPDLLGGSRDIFLQNVGGDDWRAFESRPPGAPARCVLEWEPAERVFIDICGTATYPADGSGLVSYPARVDEDGRVVVDLRSPTEPGTTTTTVPTASAPSVSGSPS
jgi:hypothetical protein